MAQAPLNQNPRAMNSIADMDTTPNQKSKNTPEQMAKAMRLISDWQFMMSVRGNWNSHWTEIAERFYPMHSTLFQQFSNPLSQQGDKRNSEIYDSTAVLALKRFGSILDSLLTPANQTWHNLQPQDPALRRDRPTRLWFEEANRILMQQRYSPRTNFAAQNQLQYTSLGAYGTGALFIDQLWGTPGLRYRNIHLSELYLRENHQGLVDAVCRYFQLSARQALQKFGERCPDMIAEAALTTPDKTFFFLHWVMPNEDRDMQRKDYKGMAFESVYISIQGSEIVDEGGYRTFPYSVSRYEQSPGEVYGRGPAMDVLPSVKTLNEQKKTMLKQGHRVVDPVLLAHDDGALDGFSLEPGSLNPGGVDSAGRILVHALPTGNVQAGKELMEDERNLINDAFLVNLFQILTENPEMTATEVQERVREKGILLAPTIGRQQSEYLGPLIDRELDLLSQQNLLPPMPRMLAQARGQYKISYDSPISKTQRAEQAAGAMRTAEMLSQAAQQTGDQSLLDYMNWDVALPQIADINGTPASWINDEQTIDAKRAQRAKQQGMQAMIQAAPAAAAMMKAAPQGGPAQAGGMGMGQPPPPPNQIMPQQANLSTPAPQGAKLPK